MYHELTHVAHYQALGNSWYNSFVDAEVSEIIGNWGGTHAPYGQNTGASAGIIALGESWAYYMGHYLADRQYGTIAGCQREQAGGGTFCNYSNTGHTHLYVEENFDPYLTNDPFLWIAKG